MKLRAGKAWTTEEMNYLENKWGRVTVSYIAKKLGRTETSITLKAQRMKLGSRLAGEYVTFNELLTALGLQGSYSWLRDKYINKNGLPAKRKGKYLIIKIDDFWKWAEQHKQILNFCHFEENMLGKEPEWVKEKRKADLSNPRKVNNNRPWTKEDDALLIQKTKSCRYTYKDLSKDLRRTENAIKRRLYDLGVPYRPIPMDTHVKWTDEENNKMMELYKKGFDSYVIANILNKSQLSISDRIKALGG